MGIHQHFDENNRPPFHVNVNYPYINKHFPKEQNIYYEKIKNNSDQPKDNKRKLKKEKNKSSSKSKDKYKESKKEKMIHDIEDDMSIDIDLINRNKVNVKIPVKKNKYWQKVYNKNELIKSIIEDYLKENKLKLPEDYFNELRCFNKEVNLEDKISSLLPDDSLDENYFDEENNINKNIDLVPENEKFSEIVGKPFNNPFQILCFYKNLKKFKILCYNDELIEQTKMNKFNKTSAYCNGYNHLYISGGENSLKYFWDINLKKNIIHEPIKIPPKKYHSMIFIPKFIVFLVGGNNSDTFYYNLKEKKLINWGKLNIIRIEPALLVVKNKLYCVESTSSISHVNNYTLEVTDLTSNLGKWKLIKPKFSHIINNIAFSQQLFGISKDNDDNIIFLGGTLNLNRNILNNNNANFMYYINDNTIGLSKVKYKQFNLKEKSFCPFNNTYDFVLTDFPISTPQIAFYNRKKKKIEIINFSPDNKEIFNNETNNEIHSKNSDKLSNISPIFSFRDKNIDNNISFNNLDNKGIFVSFRPEEKSVDEKGNFVGMRNPNKKFMNNISPINQSNNNKNILRKNTPQFKNGNKNYNINMNNIEKNTLLHNTKTTYNNNFSRTPDKISNKLRNLNVPNEIRYTEYEEGRNSAHSYDSVRKYYYPRKGVNSKRLGNNYFMNNYYTNQFY